ncbi:SMP-30/gluconolactonase/LRE family protein [Micromonospora sp. NPDC005161]
MPGTWAHPTASTPARAGASSTTLTASPTRSPRVRARRPSRCRSAGWHPDGIAVDADGGVWVASWGSGMVFRYTPDLAPDRTLRLPAPLVTNMSFGGPGYRWIFVTTARSDGAELSGAVFTADVGVAGLPAARFAVQR